MVSPKDPKKPNPSPTHRRHTIAKNREIRHLLQGEDCRLSIGDLYKGCEIFGLTKGQFSSINLIEECLNQIGEAHVRIATWTTAHAEIKKAFEFLQHGSIKSLKFLVDRSFPNRQPEYCKTLMEHFGEDAVRATRTHAKFITIRNDDWDLVIRSSMNLNENKRIEVFEISDDHAMAEYLDTVVEMLFDEPLDWTASNFSTFGGVSAEDAKLLRVPTGGMVPTEAGVPDFDMDVEF